ncbi:MAG: PA2779 family protein [Phycisphaerales bacterium]|nr:PA2779 family protein [Phycisphaerales bacterium]
MPAGQGAVGAVVGVILILFLVLLLTDLLGLTDVFPFVNKQR